MEKLKRYIIFIIGLFINSFGVAFITKASLGTSPISSIPYVLSLNFSLTLGTFTILFNVLIIILQVIILKKNFKAEHLLQFPVTIAFGYFIDLSMGMLSFIHPELYVFKVLYLLLGCIILGFGVYLEVLANVVMLPGESFVRAIVFRFKTEFGITKIIFDSSMTVIAGVLSFILSHQLEGVREGTIIAALMVGFIARQFGRLLSFLPDKLFKAVDVDDDNSNTYAPEVVNCIVIGRQYGCRGSLLGEEIAKKFGYAFYDKELIQLTAGSTGYEPDYISKQEENMKNSFLYDIVSQVYSQESDMAAPKDQIYDAESKVIKELASKGNCVIVGRCADAILKGQKNCLSVFMYAPKSIRIENIMKQQKISQYEAENLIQKTDRRRADNYRYYTDRIWGLASNYDVCIDTSFGDEYVMNVIENTITARR